MYTHTHIYICALALPWRRGLRSSVRVEPRCLAVRSVSALWSPQDKRPATPWQQHALLDRHPGDEPPCKTVWPWPLVAFSFLVGVVVASTMGVMSGGLMASTASARRFSKVRQGVDAASGLPLAWLDGDCGSSPAEARARGCRFISTLFAWLLRDCIADGDVEDEALMYRDRDWPYLVGGRNMTLDEVWAGDYHYLTTTFDMHMAHCMFTFKRMHRVLLDRAAKMDSYSVDFGHTSHCVDLWELRGATRAPPRRQIPDLPVTATAPCRGQDPVRAPKPVSVLADVSREAATPRRQPPWHS